MHWIAPLILATLGPVERAPEFNPFVTAVPVNVQAFGEDCDTDYDGLPDEWTRRSGPQFPHYIDAHIDRRHGHDAPGSLAISSDGGAAAFYSPPIRIDSGHLYVFEAYLRTQKLTGDAAICSVSILDEQMNRVERYLTAPVSGTHADWVQVRIGPVQVTAAQRFIVIGCHLVCGSKLDLGGKALFDDIRLGRTPSLTLKREGGPLLHTSEAAELDVCVAGISSDSFYQLSLELYDAQGTQVNRVLHRIDRGQDGEKSTPTQLLTIPWTMPGLQSGYYVLHAYLTEDRQVVAYRKTAFVVTEPTPPLIDSLFGWSLRTLPSHLEAEDLADLATEAGVGHVKIPLWRNAFDRVEANRSVALIEQLSIRHIDVVGVLDPPPHELRRKFASEWTGVGEVFQLPEKLWAPSLAPVVARYGAQVQDWQLGHDEDRSFDDSFDLASIIEVMRATFSRVGRDSRFGVPWLNSSPIPQNFEGFVTIPIEDDSTTAALFKEGVEIWSTITPLSSAEKSLDERALDLVRRMVAARVKGATRISLFEGEVAEDGLIDADGSPKELFLPWRTTTFALRNLDYLGALDLPQGSKNWVFGDETSAAIVIWNDNDVTETLALGGDPQAADLWSRKKGLTVDAVGLTSVKVSPSPVFLTEISPALLRWQLAAGFQNATLLSQHGPQRLEIVGMNPFSQGVSGTVTLLPPKGWDVETSQWPLRLAAGEEFRLPVILSLPADTSLGSHRVELKFEIQSDRPYSFTVARDITVGLGDVEIEIAGKLLPDGRLEVIQSIINQTEPEEVLSFRCDLFIPGEQRKRHYVVKLGRGRDVKRYYVANGAALIGQELRVRAEQENGRRVLNYRWLAGSNASD